MALANVAYILATTPLYGGKKVLMIDWDLEAPGLYRYFDADLKTNSGLSLSARSNDRLVDKAQGLIEFLEAAAKIYKERAPNGGLPESQAHTPEAADIYAELRRTSGFDEKLLLQVGDNQNLKLLKAGYEDETYPNRVRAFEWEKFYEGHGSFFTHFRQHLSEEFDYILIDSRTGLTDTSGICTRVMPEKLVGVFAPNTQNIEGLKGVILRAVEYRRSSRDPRSLMIFPLASRIDSQASKLRKAWWKGGRVSGHVLEGYQKTFEDLFIEMFDLDQCDLHDYFDATQIPHDSDYAYGEEIAARYDLGSHDKLSIETACTNLTDRLLYLDAPWEPYSDTIKLSEAQRQAEDATQLTVELSRDRRRLRRIAIALSVVVLIMASAFFLWYHFRPTGPQPGQVQDEARLAGRDSSSLVAAEEDYFRYMDGGINLTPEEIKGRNTWLVWTAGNDRFWDRMANATFGTLDLLKIVSSHPKQKFSRDNRWDNFGLVNTPCFEKATAPDPKRFGLWLDKRNPGCTPDPFEDAIRYPGVRIGARGKNLEVGSYYGYETGILGLRLFPNPDFDEEAAKRWDAERFYSDPSYFSRQDLIRPYRVGMSCAFCHAGPSPTKPPSDPNNPKWENLSSSVGAQYLLADRIFDWNADNSSFLFQLLHTARPGTMDTSLLFPDNINNPTTVSPLYLTLTRLEVAKRWGKETVLGGAKENRQLNDYISHGFLRELFEPPDTVFTTRMSKDGSDSVGVVGALNRFYLTIGASSQEALLHVNPFIGGKAAIPMQIRVARADTFVNATEDQTANLLLFLLKVGAPHYLKDAPGGSAYLTTDAAQLKRGKIVFAERCASCHSSKIPSPAPGIDEGRGCAGKDYLTCWNKYWEWTKTEDFKARMRQIVLADDFLDNNYLSTDLRIPVTLLQTNACGSLGSNATAGNIWDNFSSQSYKDLPSVGAITVYDPLTGEPRPYQMPAGGRGYVRPPSLVSVWATAPFLLDNSIGPFNSSPSVDARMKSFNQAIEQLLWPERRARDSILQDKVPGMIDRTTQASTLRIPAAYLPDVLKRSGFWSRNFPFLFADEDWEIGPLPKGMPIGLLANLDLLSDSSDANAVAKRQQDVLKLLLDIKKRLSQLPAGATDEERARALAPLVGPLLQFSKCPDLVVGRGHYFGTAKNQGETELSDDDKRALIEFLKTF